jgi:hypothetical protein
MHLIEGNHQPTDQQLGFFGWLHFSDLPAVAWSSFESSHTVNFVIALGSLVAALGSLQPQLLKAWFIGLSDATRPIVWLIGELLVAIIFFGFVTPIGRFRKLLGNNALGEQRKPNGESYRVKRLEIVDVDRYRRMY